MTFWNVFFGVFAGIIAGVGINIGLGYINRGYPQLFFFQHQISREPYPPSLEYKKKNCVD